MSEIRVPALVRRGALFLDYDGTLAPIVARPRQAVMSPATRAVLSRFARHSRWKVAIVSGRRLADVQRRVRMDDLIYVGNHGFEIQFPGQPPFIHPMAKGTRPLLKTVKAAVQASISGLDGVILEDKEYTLSLHTRLADVAAERRAHLALVSATRAAVREKRLVLRRGKKVLEVRPAVRWDKGRAIEEILRSFREPAFPVFIGDDNTDEDAFRALRRGGLTIRVGKGETNARYFVPGVADVRPVLRELISLLPAS